MRSTRFRLTAFALIAAGVGAVLLSQPRPTAAQPVKPTGPGEKPEEKLEKVSFPESKQTNELFRGLLEYADPESKDPNWKNLFRVAQLILDAKSDYFFQYTDGPGKGERRSVKEETNRIIGGLRKEGLEFYQSFYGPMADNLLQQAKEDGYDRPKLAEIAQRFYHTKAGAEAAMLLAAIHLDSGNYPEAAYGYRKLLARPDADKLLDPRTLFRAAVALRRAGDGKQTDEVAAVWDKLEKKFPQNGLQVGRKAYSVEQLKAELERPVQSLYATVGAEFVAGRGGDNTRTAPAEAGVPFLQAEQTQSMFITLGQEEQERGNNWVKTAIAAAYNNPTLKTKKTALIPSLFPVTAPNLVIFRGYDGVYAFYTKDCKDSAGRAKAPGDLAWFTDARWGAAHIQRATVRGGEDSSLLTQDKTNLDSWYGTWQQLLPGVIFENPLAGSLSHDGKRVYFVDDYNVPPSVAQANPEFGFQPGMAQAAQGGKVEYNRLVAVDLETGMLAWTLGEIASGRREDEDKIASAAELGEGAYFLGPPVSVNGKLYALLERDGALNLACFDPNKESAVVKAAAKPGRRSTRQPELVWVQNLGRANTPIKQDAGRRFQGAFLATADGVMVCPTNSGAVVGVDLNARSLLWAHTYATAEATNPGGGMGRPWGGGAMVMTGTIKDQRWRAAAPLIAGGRVLVSAYDGDSLQCLDLRTGKLKWQERRKPDDLYVGGVAGDKVLIVGSKSVRAVKLVGEPRENPSGRDTPELTTSAWESDLKIATPVGHGVVGKDGHFYLPVVGDPDKPDDKTPSVLAVNTATGKIHANIPYRRKDNGPTPADPRTVLGNLIFHDGLMFSQSATELAWFPLNEVKRREADTALAANPNDPVGLLSSGELDLEGGRLTDAIAKFKKSGANKPDEPTARKLKNKLYDAYTQFIRNEADFGKVDPILDEYKALCDVPLTPDDPVNYPRQLEELTRRRGLYLTLLADGRERQGRLVDAFDAYRAYASLGDRSKMLPVPEDPSTLALPEVWAAGRIDAMMRKAKDPAARKPLEDRVGAEWADVKAANDLERLRAFVRSFGPYFESGREAQYLLADRLTATNDDANRREAQALLLNLTAQAEDDRDPTAAARATDALARVLTDRGLTDDALGLYRRIAERYPTATIRDGKTGADLLGELIADKRYLPSLESDRPPAFGKYKAEASNGGAFRASQSSLGLVNDSSALSFYRRNRVTLDYDVYGNGSAALTVTDRVTREQKVKFEAMPINFYSYNNGGLMGANTTLANQRLAQVSGHMLLLNTFGPTGGWVHCYDLTGSSKKELWKVPLHGPNWPPNQAQGNGVQWNQEIDAAGDMNVVPYWFNQFTGQQTFDWAFRLGRSAVLQPNYAAVITKDGLSCRDPRTGAVLWQRAGLAPKSMIFGDARHLFVVEMAANSFTSRVFRAVDGVQLPKVPEFGKLAISPSRLHIIGRTVLLFETAKGDRDADKPAGKVLRLYDCLEGKDVWRKEYPAEAAALETLDSELTGVVTASGKIEIFASRTGETLQTMACDPGKEDEHVKDGRGRFAVVKPLLLADADRYYVFLNRAPAANQMQPEQQGMNPPQSPTRLRVVNGVAYAFDRGTGKRQWFHHWAFVNQRLIVERFDDLPCLLLTNPMTTPDPTEPNLGGTRGGIVHRVTVVDKANGSVQQMKDLPANNNWLQGLGYDSKTGAWEFGGANNQQRLTITPLVAPTPSATK
ncbi:MAG: PQQ-binding-like beta-propeller repeat protein [Fimbriiglobus sp.]|nr:PQQ-binding-like beta-propeller repeat protein [Fimbriiglobus sp.]